MLTSQSPFPSLDDCHIFYLHAYIEFESDIWTCTNILQMSRVLEKPPNHSIIEFGEVLKFFDTEIMYLYQSLLHTV